jgi:hypothetical protein
MNFEQAAYLRDAITKLKQRAANARTALGETNEPIKVRRSEVDATGKSKGRKNAPKGAPGTPGTKSGRKRR